MSIISIRIEVETVLANYLAKGKHVDSEEEGSKHRALRHDWLTGAGVELESPMVTNCLLFVR